jgi:hypothetical protein
VTVMAGFPVEFKGENAGHAYVTVVAFSCSGRAFWANLVRGVMYCSCDDLLLSASNGPWAASETRPSSSPPSMASSRCSTSLTVR